MIINLVRNSKRLSQSPARGFIQKGIKRTAESSLVKSLIDRQVGNPDFLPRFLLGIILLKAFFATAIAATASWNNKGMPEEQRRFSAGVVGMTGLFNILSIATIGNFINKNSDKWVESIARSYKNLKQMKNYELAKSGARSILTLVVSGILVQRALVPFIATPVAKWFKEKYLIPEDALQKAQIGKGIAFTQQAHDLRQLNTFDPANPFSYFENKIKTKPVSSKHSVSFTGAKLDLYDIELPPEYVFSFLKAGDTKELKDFNDFCKVIFDEKQQKYDDQFMERMLKIHKKILKDPKAALCLVKNYDNDIIGSFLIRPSKIEKIAIAERLYIHPNCRQKHLGSLMLRKLVRTVKDKGYSVMVGVQSPMAKKIKFYERIDPDFVREVNKHDMLVIDVENRMHLNIIELINPFLYLHPLRLLDPLTYFSFDILPDKTVELILDEMYAHKKELMGT